MITGVWISPDNKQVAIQFFEETIVRVDETGESDVDDVPADWSALFETA